ncbi:Recombination hotspot-binding protein [Neofusicoccum parvum]|nr:Recombination hotspot-binding protein [Neofusicoccum parvum]
MAQRQGMVDPAIFEQLQERVDQDTTVREELRDIIQTLEKQGRSAQSILARAHSTPSADLPDVVTSAEAAIRYEIDAVQKLAEAASKHPYYKFNGIWSRQVQDTVFTILYCGYLGGFTSEGSDAKVGRLLTIEEVGGIMNVPVNLKDRDAFHLTIEEYLQALISLIEELARLARNSVTLGDYSRPMQIAQFIKDVHAGFQILNLKNDALRRRSDGIKYRTIFTRIEDPAAKTASVPAPVASSSPSSSSSKPIETLNTDIARIYTHLHPFLVVSIFALQFNGVVADPAASLFNALIPLSVLQVVYAILCLPAAGSSSSKSSGARRKGPGGKAEAGVSSKVSTAVLSLILSTIAGVPLVSIILILFGAPLTTHLGHTVLCAAHIAYLAAVPTIYAFGVDGAKWRELVALMVPVDEVVGAAIGTLVGAWAGAVPIPLDWDREWQKWPVTIVCGAAWCIPFQAQVNKLSLLLNIMLTAKASDAADEDSLFIPKDDPAPADVSMPDADVTSTTEPANTAGAAEASAGASRPEDARISSVRGSQTPAGSPAPGSPASTGAARGGKKAVNRMPTFKGRRSKEEREALEAEAERKRREKLQELNNEANAGRENRSRMIHRGKTFGASHAGGVKRERTVFKSEGDNDGAKGDEPDDGGYISSDPEIEMLGPRQDVDNIETINLVSDDENEDVGMAGGPSSQSRHSRIRFNTPGLAPVRIRRREHENAPRKITAEAPGDPEIKTEVDTSSPRKGKGKAKDVEVTGSQGRWKGAWGYTEDDKGVVTIKDEPTDEPDAVPSEIPEEPVKDAPSSPELSRKTKPKVKQRRKPRFRDIRAALVSEEDKEEQERHEESMRVLADELGEIVLPPPTLADADGDTTMGESEKPKEDQPVDKKADRVYLFQLPPVLPSLTVDDTVKREPQSPEATSRSNPIDLATPENNSNTPVKIEDDGGALDTVSPDLPTQLASGAVGKLRVHKSGRTTLDWGGTSLELSMGMDASFLQDIIVTKITPEEQRVGRDGGEAMSFGQVCGKFVVTPDWDEIVG